MNTTFKIILLFLFLISVQSQSLELGNTKASVKKKYNTTESSYRGMDGLSVENGEYYCTYFFDDDICFEMQITPKSLEALNKAIVYNNENLEKIDNNTWKGIDKNYVYEVNLYTYDAENRTYFSITKFK